MAARCGGGGRDVSGVPHGGWTIAPSTVAASGMLRIGRNTYFRCWHRAMRGRPAPLPPHSARSRRRGSGCAVTGKECQECQLWRVGCVGSVVAGGQAASAEEPSPSAPLLVTRERGNEDGALGDSWRHDAESATGTQHSEPRSRCAGAGLGVRALGQERPDFRLEVAVSWHFAPSVRELVLTCGWTRSLDKLETRVSGFERLFPLQSTIVSPRRLRPPNGEPAELGARVHRAARVPRAQR